MPSLLALILWAAPRLVSSDEEEHLDDFEEAFEECEHSCEVCETRHCQNLWLEKPSGRHLTIAELTWTQNVCIVLLVFLLTSFARIYYYVKKIADKYELRHRENLWPERKACVNHWEGDIEGEEGPPPPKALGKASDNTDLQTTRTHAVLYRAFAFGATSKRPVIADSPAHATIERVLRSVPTRHYYQGMLESFTVELMGLGFVSIFVWVAEISGFFKAAAVGEDGRWGPQTPEQAKKTFEDVHFAVFGGVLLYFLVMFRAVRHAVHRYDCFMGSELRLAIDRRPNGDKEEIEAIDPCSNEFKEEGATHFPKIRTALIEWLRDNVDDLDEEFSSPHLTRDIFEAAGDDFPVAIYLRLCLDNLIEHTIEVENSTWVTIIVVYGIEATFARTAMIDIPAISLGVATIWNLSIFLMIVGARYELKKFTKDHTKVGHTGTREHWWLKQIPRFLQAATLYVVIQFTRFCIDTIVDPKTQRQRYRGKASYNAWLCLQVANVLVHVFLVSAAFQEITLELALPPVLGKKSLSVIAEISLIYAHLAHRIGGASTAPIHFD